MRAADGQELFPLAFAQHAPRRESIQGHSSEHEQGPNATFVLQQNDEVVSEVEIGLERT